MLGNTHSGNDTTSVTNPMIKHVIVVSISTGVDIGLEYEKSFMLIHHWFNKRRLPNRS
jgi:hypothetical protein